MPYQPQLMQQVSYTNIVTQNLNAILEDDDDKVSRVSTARTRRRSVRSDSSVLQRTVYVADLLPKHTERDVLNVFALHFAVLKVTKQIGTKFGYVAFENEDCVNAVLKQAVFHINRHPIRVMPYNPPTVCNADANLIVKNLEAYVNESHLMQKFNKFGEILSCKVERDAENKSRCFAYVQFKTVESAEAAIDELNNTYWEEEYDPDKQFRMKAYKQQRQLGDEEVKGKKMYVGVFKKKDTYYKEKVQKEGRESNLYVENLGSSFGDRDLYELFKPFGTIKSAKIRRDKSTGCPMGRGFVDFENPDHADEALQALDGYVLANFRGRIIKVKYATCKSRRQRRKEEAELQQQQQQQQQYQHDTNDNDAFSTSGLSDTTTSDATTTPIPTPPPQQFTHTDNTVYSNSNSNSNNYFDHWIESLISRQDCNEYRLF